MALAGCTLHQQERCDRVLQAYQLGLISGSQLPELGSLETTVNNVSFFKHFRQVHHGDGTSSNR